MNTAYRLYLLNEPISSIIESFRQRTGCLPSVAIVHLQALSQVRAVLPFARVRMPNEPIPQPSHLYLAAE